MVNIPTIPGDAGAFLTFMPSGGQQTISSIISFETPRADQFGTRVPKPDNIIAVKLTKNNITTVAGEIIKALGKGSVEVLNGRLWVNAVNYDIDDWVVEEYDYDTGTAFYRPAKRDERVKYDLR